MKEKEGRGRKKMREGKGEKGANGGGRREGEGHEGGKKGREKMREREKWANVHQESGGNTTKSAYRGRRKIDVGRRIDRVKETLVLIELAKYERSLPL